MQAGKRQVTPGTVPVYARSQTFAAELAPEQREAFSFCRAGVTWFYNEASHSQHDRYRHRAGVEGCMSLGYAVSVARRAGVEFPYRGTAQPVSNVPAVMLHGALRQLSAGWTRHFEALAEWKKYPHKPGEKCPSSPPGFRSVHRGGSLYWQVQDNSGPRLLSKTITVIRKGTGDRPAMAMIRVPGQIGPVTIRYHRELPADTMIRFVSLRVDDLGRYWVTLQYTTAQVRQPAPDGVVGVDVGVMVTAATSDGQVYSAPRLLPGQQQRKDRLKRSMSRKRRLNPCRHDHFVTVAGRTRLRREHCPPPGHPDHDCGCWKHSRRYARNKAAFLELSQRQVRQRTAGAHLASRALADRYAVVVMEDLSVSGMTSSAKGTEEEPGRNVRQKAGLNREILASNWYQLRQFTAYKTSLVSVPAPYTSLTCPADGTVDKRNRPSRDLFSCITCGLSGHADIIAAQNIRDRHMVPAAAAQAVTAREICLGSSQQPVNVQLDSVSAPAPGAACEYPGSKPPPGEHSHAGQPPDIILQPTGNLIPGAWGRIGARKRPERRRSRRPKIASRGSGG
jgi:transposase